MITENEFMRCNGKSRITSLILTLLLGPIGLLYSSIAAGIVLLVLVIVTAPTVIGPIGFWLFSVALGDHLTYSFNKRVKMDFKIKSGL